MDYHLVLLFSFLVTTVASEDKTTADNMERVVSSSVVLNCPSTTTDIETVKWKINSSDVPFLSYFPKDDAVDPPDFDPRFVIKGDTNLRIDNLNWGDSGKYECSIASAALPMELTRSVYLTIIGGCFISNYSRTLLPLTKNCYPSSYIEFGSQCSFVCANDFEVIGNASTQCLADGSLSTGLPLCSASVCRVPDLPPHVISLSQNCSASCGATVGSSCTFGCENGFAMIGDNVITCSDNGNFDNSLPTCKENTCIVTIIPQDTVDVYSNCSVGSNISYHTDCIFTCEDGYSLNGSSTAKCLGHDQFSEEFPFCTELQSSSMNMNLLALTVLIPFFVVVILLAVYLLKRKEDLPKQGFRCPVGEHPDIELSDDGLRHTEQTESTPQNTRVSFQDDNHNDENELPFRQQKYTKDLFKGYYQLLTQQIDKDNRIDILRRLHQIESTVILPSMPSSDLIQFIRSNFISVHQKHSKNASIEQAFAWYITVVLSFIEDKNISKSLKRDILGMTGQRCEEKQRLIRSPSSGSGSEGYSVSEKKRIKEFLNIIHIAFVNVLETEGRFIHDEKEKSNRTAKVAREVGSFLGQHNTISESNGSSRKSDSTAASQENTKNDIYFAKLCVSHIAECESVTDAVDLRYLILEHFITPFFKIEEAL